MLKTLLRITFKFFSLNFFKHRSQGGAFFCLFDLIAILRLTTARFLLLQKSSVFLHIDSKLNFLIFCVCCSKQDVI